MQKGFGLIGFIVIILVLLLAVGGGFWLGRMSLTTNTDNTLQEAILNQNANLSTPETVLMKRSFDPSQEIYPGKPLPQEITGTAEQDLVGFNCDGPYMESQGQYLWGIQLEEELYYKPLSEDLSKFTTDTNTYLQQVGTKQPAAYITYCITEKGEKYLLAGQYLSGGGAGTDTYIFDLAQGINSPLTGVIKSEPWAYFGCANIMQMTNESMYIACSAGDGGGSGQAIYKKNLANSQVIAVIKCTSQMSEDMETSNISCE